MEAEIYRTPDGEIAKYVHTDGTETAIKAVTPKNPHLGHDPISCSKYAVFPSTSYGCPVRCKHCYLTIKKCMYEPLNIGIIIGNVKEAIRREVNEKPELADKWFKLSWMGMGDPMYVAKYVPEMSYEIIEWVLSNQLAAGLDGVDLSTTLPRVWEPNHFENFNKFNHYLSNFKWNETNTESRSKFRFFYSLLSMFPEKRQEIVPNSDYLNTGLAMMKTLRKEMSYDIICHHLLFDGINDQMEEVVELANYFSENDIELRFLRYNECDNSPYKQSPRFDWIVDYLRTRVQRLKFQASVGNEIKAACGQFILKKLENK